MKPHQLVSLLCVLPAMSFGQVSPDIQVRPLGNDSFELLLHTSKSTDVAAGQAELRPTANALCHDRPYSFGHYKFETIEALVGAPADASPSLILTQTIRCGSTDAGTSPQPSSSTALEWAPSATDQTRIQDQTYAYLHAKDIGNYADAYAMFTDSMKDATTVESFEASTERFNSLAGTVLNRQIVKISWYQNPPSAPTAGIYAAADFTSKFANIDVHCGYVAWYQESDGSFRIIREEENYVDKATQATMKSDEIDAFEAKYGCHPH